ncbi:hypothetical protein EZJ43_01705 [Pedobacter changchengzhani]|uniref:Uncharacterized protein n=1 Tax=Pedobacter changchengzhani TaxID=2529274 RepID=A0A4V6PJA4_9SPHI|nr:hypothetical protein [Pedobacter changchengzhani]TDG37833.1 hypothetical protein EZJ43_01705 [Pedobacter changchengzhani]
MMGNAKQILESQNIYFGDVNINGIDCTVGYIKEFKWSWFGTQLNTFIFIANTDQQVNASGLQQFSKNCYDFAIANNRGWPRGLQSAVGSIAVLQAKNIENDAIKFAEGASPTHFSAFEFVVLMDMDKRTVYKCRTAPIWGAIYNSYFTATINWLVSKF